MKVVIYGSNGMLGPHVVKALEGQVELRLTDLEPFDTPHDMVPVDVADADAVMRAAEGMDAIINLSVLRPHRKIAFDVNTMGCYNIMRAAVAHGIPRVINTGAAFHRARRALRGVGLRHWPGCAAQAEHEFVRTVQGLGPRDLPDFRRELRRACVVLLVLHFLFS